MRSPARSLLLSAAVALIAALALAGTPGSFRGTVVDGPLVSSGKSWLYVQGRNGSARRVEITHARVIYDDAIPAAERARNPQDALVPGAEVRVSAEQGSDGEWKASRIEILKTAGTRSSASQSLLRGAP